jgi:hypothetical protein
MGRWQGLRAMDGRQQAALALGAFLLVGELALQVVTGQVNVALAGAGVSIFGLAFTLPRDKQRNGNGEGGP